MLVGNGRLIERQSIRNDIGRFCGPDLQAAGARQEAGVRDKNLNAHPLPGLQPSLKEKFLTAP